MPNHLHFLLYYAGGSQSLNILIGNGKRFMANVIVKQLVLKGRTELLAQLQAGVLARDKQHEVWKDSFDVKAGRTEKFMLQNLVYLHENPVRGKWKLSATSVDYLHSSAVF